MGLEGLLDVGLTEPLLPLAFALFEPGGVCTLRLGPDLLAISVAVSIISLLDRVVVSVFGSLVSSEVSLNC